MKACIYARTCRKERLHHTTSVDKQVAYGREAAHRCNFSLQDEHIFTDAERPGDLMPSCWAPEGQDSRAALSALVAAIENREVNRVLVRRADKLGTSSAVLQQLLDLFTQYDVWIVVAPEPGEETDDPVTRFAVSILQPRICVEESLDVERRARTRTKKREEIERLQARIARLEAEIAGMARD
jgi:DNA invertase Pin-like site-specific DNA recombinase